MGLLLVVISAAQAEAVEFPKGGEIGHEGRWILVGFVYLSALVT